jgi:hypothetical protein
MYTGQYNVAKAITFIVYGWGSGSEKNVLSMWSKFSGQTRNYHLVVHFTHGVFSRVQLMENRADVN